MPTKPPKPEANLTLRELNRATLARQLLLQRESIGVVEAVERLAGLQAQYSPSPYVALWTRLQDFRHEQLTEALHARTVVKASLMRWTLHTVSARDYPYFSRAITNARLHPLSDLVEKEGLDLPHLHGRLLDFVSTPQVQADIVEYLNAQVPGSPERHVRLIWHATTGLGGVVHVPPSGVWKFFGKNPYLAASQWLDAGEEPSVEEAVLYLVRRYLAAYGPASRPDVLQWSGLRMVSQVNAALRTLGDEVVVFAGEGGKLLYDLRDAPRLGGDVASPPRFLAKWDNVLLAHDDRNRILPDRYRKTVIKKNGDVIPTFLVDGMVAGLWTPLLKRDIATLELEPLEPVDPSTRQLLQEEGERLIRFYEPDARSYNVVFTDA